MEIENSTISANGDIGIIEIGSKLTPQTVVINNSNLTTESKTQTAGDISIDARDRIEILNDSNISGNVLLP